jgi:hypothetical protein
MLGPTSTRDLVRPDLFAVESSMQMDDEELPRVAERSR